MCSEEKKTEIDPMKDYPQTTTTLDEDTRGTFPIVVKFNERAARDFIEMVEEKDPSLKKVGGLSSTAYVMRSLLRFLSDKKANS